MKGVYLPIPYGGASIPRNMPRIRRAGGKHPGSLRTRNPFPHMSGSIARSHQRKLAKSPKPR